MQVSNLVDDGSRQPDETQANKIQKPNQKKTTLERGNLLDSENPEWLQVFMENLVDDEIPLQGSSHDSSSHEVSFEPTTKKREDLGNISKKNARAANRPKLQGPHAEDAMARPYLVLKNFGDLITANHKILNDNCESRNNHRYAVVVQDFATQWIQAYPCKNKTSQKTRETCKSSWNPTRSLKSFTLTIPWNSANFVKISPVIIARLHHTDRRPMVFRKEQFAK